MKHDHVLIAQPSYEPIFHAWVPHERVLCAQDLHKHVVHAHDSFQTVLPPQDSHEPILQGQPSHKGVLHAQPLLEPVQPWPISRKKCKQQAHKEATTLFNAHNEIATPPEPIPVNGLYILITEIDEQ